MAKMIEPDKLAHELERFHFSTGHLVKIQAAMEAATVEVDVPVRCKDCVHLLTGEDMYPACEMWRAEVELDFYCACGKRKPTCSEEGCSFG